MNTEFTSMIDEIDSLITENAAPMRRYLERLAHSADTLVRQWVDITRRGRDTIGFTGHGL